MHRIFVDEVGNHDLKASDDPNHRYLGLTGVIMPLDYERGPFSRALSAIKQETFGSADIILHRREMLSARPPFEALANTDVRERFDTLLLTLINDEQYRVCTVIIDKKEHKQKYAVWRFHPYHYCMTVLLERYVLFLRQIDRLGDVMVESRGKKENIQLENAFRYIYENGSAHVPAKLFRQRLTSRQLKIQAKSANVAGLQLADLIANPSCRGLICEKTGAPMTAGFGSKIEAVLQNSKYLRRFDGTITGWGTKWLP